METIKNYLESMFRGLPQTDKIMKAKSELLQMMEDKYTELIRSGKTENEAVGEVIQNFGNLEDLADDLGIDDILHATKYSDVQRRKLSFDEVTEYISAAKKSILMHALGIMFCIISVTGPIMCDALDLNDMIGVTAMFLFIGCGIVLMVMSNALMEQWSFIKSEPCSVDAVSIDYLKNKIRDFTPTYSVLSSVGVLLCVLCFIPAAVLDEFGNGVMEDLGGALLFVFVGVGVLMMVYAKQVKKSYLRLLGINEKVDFKEPSYSPSKIQNKTVRVIMSVYWSVVTCLYLCVSFLTFCWHITWIIWPVAAVVFTTIKAIYSTDNENKKEKDQREE